MDNRTLYSQRFNRRILPLMTAVSIGVSTVPMVFADPGDVNSVNTGNVVQGGTYYNTSNGQTTFRPGSNGGGLWIQNGTVVRGLEVDGANNLTGNGGNMHFSAPGSVVRVDGTIDVSGLMGRGYTTANGGRVTVDAAMLYQNGNIYAGGYNGGLIQFNVGAATFTPNSVTSAQGIGGAGGSIIVNSSGAVDIQRNYTSEGQRAALIDASGKYIGSIDSNVINIQGSVVNNEGIVRANGQVVADGHIVHLYNESKSDIVQGDLVKSVNNRLGISPQEGTLMTTGSEGGTIRVVATGSGTGDNTGACIAECAVNKAAVTPIDETGKTIFTASEAQAINARGKALLDAHNGDVVVGAQGVFQANGSSVKLGEFLGAKYVDKGFGYYEQKLNSLLKAGRTGKISDFYSEEGGNAAFNQGGDGGVLLISAKRDVTIKNDGFNGGLLSARGGNGNGYTYQTLAWDRGRLRLVDRYQTFNAGDGGMISVNAQRDINFGGSAHAFGGTGYQNGSAALTPQELAWINDNHKNLPSDYSYDNRDNRVGGFGGNGGTIAFSYGRKFNNQIVDSLNGFTRVLTGDAATKDFVNYQQIDASGGHTGAQATVPADWYMNPRGGLVVFSGETNPTELGNVSVYRGQGPDGSTAIDHSRFGTVVLPNAADPVSLAQLHNVNTNFKPDTTQLYVDNLNGDELILGRNTMLLLSTSEHQNLSDKFANAVVRSTVDGDVGSGHYIVAPGAASSVLASKYVGQVKNLLVSSTNSSELNLDKPAAFEGNGFSNLTSLMVSNAARGNASSHLHNQADWVVGGNNAAGGFLSLMADGRITNIRHTLAVSGTQLDGSISLATNQAIINTGYIGGSGNAYQGASIILKACRDILNQGVWRFASPSWAYHPDSWSQANENVGMISANGKLNGGRIELLANNNILNLGTIRTNGDAVGGTVFSHAGNNNLNFGSITANAGSNYSEGGQGVGGYVRLHGNNIAANIDLSTLLDPSAYAYDINVTKDGVIKISTPFGPGQIEATGSGNGGSVFVTAGGTCGVGCTNNNPTDTVTGAGSTINNLLSALLSQDTLPGFSTFQNTPLVTTMDLAVDMTRPGSALNLGHIDSRGRLDGGQTWLVGDGQVGIGADSSINGINVNYNEIVNAPVPSEAFQSFMTSMNSGGIINMVAGNVGSKTALEAVMCANDVPAFIPEGDSPAAGGGYAFPNNFTIPNVPPVTPGSPSTVNADIFGLFQEYRFRNDTTIPRPPAPMVLGFDQPSMFLAQAYAPVTQEILALAALEYNRVLSDGTTATQGGETHQRAFEMAKLYLTDAGVDEEVAKGLLTKIDEGVFKANDSIVKVLKAMAEPTPTAPEAQPQDGTLRQ